MLDAAKFKALVEKCASEFEKVLGKSEHVWIDLTWFSLGNKPFWKPLLFHLKHQSTVGEPEKDFKHVYSFKNQELHIFAYGNEHNHKYWILLSKKKYPISDLRDIFQDEKKDMVRNSKNCPDCTKRALVGALAKGLGNFPTSGIKRKKIGEVSKNKKLRQNPTHNKENIEPRLTSEGAELKAAKELVEKLQHLNQKLIEDNQRLTQKLTDENGRWIRSNDALRRELGEKMNKMKEKWKEKWNKVREVRDKFRAELAEVRQKWTDATRKKEEFRKKVDELQKSAALSLEERDHEIAELKATVEELKAVEQVQNFDPSQITATPEKMRAAMHTPDGKITADLCYLKMHVYRERSKRYQKQLLNAVEARKVRRNIENVWPVRQACLPRAFLESGTKSRGN